jgi:hypothetical protein
MRITDYIEARTIDQEDYGIKDIEVSLEVSDEAALDYIFIQINDFKLCAKKSAIKQIINSLNEMYKVVSGE